MEYGRTSVRAVEIRKDANYEGVRVTMLETFDGARCAIQVDVGYGDAVTPGADNVLFPVVLDDMPQPALRAYPVYTGLLRNMRQWSVWVLVYDAWEAPRVDLV